jgi:hypothetical protein
MGVPKISLLTALGTSHPWNLVRGLKHCPDVGVCGLTIRVVSANGNNHPRADGEQVTYDPDRVNKHQRVETEATSARSHRVMQLHMSWSGAGSHVGLPTFAEDLQGSFIPPHIRSQLQARTLTLIAQLLETGR